MSSHVDYLHQHLYITVHEICFLCNVLTLVVVDLFYPDLPHPDLPHPDVYNAGIIL